MELSVVITSLPTALPESLRQLTTLGFRHVDLIGKVNRPDAERDALAESGLMVDCVALGRDLPTGCSLDAKDSATRRQAVEEVEKQISEAAQLGARVAYVVPGKDPASLPAFAEACRVLATSARRRMIQLCVEHFPTSALPTASGTLDWFTSNGLDDMHLLLDLGHCLISREEPSHVVAQAGNRLGYVHLDDNDGVGDLHWPLLTGVLTTAMLQGFLQQLRETKYRGGIALELNAKLHDPPKNLLASKDVVARIW
jgi:sugar phosphate isomerase/epimerase